MGKRKKRKTPAVARAVRAAHRVPTNLPPKRKLIDTIDREKYNLVDLSGSESDSDLRMGFIPKRRLLPTSPTSTDNRRIDLNHSTFSPVKDCGTVRVRNSHPSKGHHDDVRHSVCVGNPARRVPSSSTDSKRTIDKKRNSSRLPDNQLNPSSSTDSKWAIDKKKNRSRLPANGHGPEISTPVEKHLPLKSEDPGVGSMLKSVVTSVLNAPDVKAIISSIPAGKDRDELIKRIVEEQLTESVVNNSELLQQLAQQASQDIIKSSDNLPEPVCSEPSKCYGEAGPSHRRSVSPVSPTPASSSTFQPIESNPRLSLLGSYISNLFDKNEIKYRDEGSAEKSMMLLIDYQAKFLLREGQLRVLPLQQYKADIAHELYCGSCRREFSSITAKADHEYGYLHQIITGEWWRSHSQPPKFLPLFSTSRRERIFIWCIICFEKHGVDSNEDLYQHLKSTHHQFNLCSWKECYNAWPQHEWCLWKDVESIKHSLPRSTVNGFDWPKEIERCVLPDYRIY